MKRREVFKGLMALGALALLPGVKVIGNPVKSNLHFVGLGSGGTNAMVNIHEKRIEAKYSCITGSHISHLKPDMEHVFYEAPRDLRVKGINYKKRIDLSTKIKSVFRDNDHYVILTGLGASVGTGLISDVLEYLQAEQKNYLSICSLPFYNEGSSKNEYAREKKEDLEGIENVLFFDHNQIPTHHPYMPIEERAKYKYAKLANLTKAETERLPDGATYCDHNGIIPDPGRLSVQERFEMGNELFYTIFKSHFPQVAEHL